MLSEGSQLVNKLIFILPMFLQQKTAPIGTVYILIIFYSAIPRSWRIIPCILFRNSNSDIGSNLIFRCSTYCFFSAFDSGFPFKFVSRCHAPLFPRIITADFAFSLFPLSHILFSVIFQQRILHQLLFSMSLSGTCQIYDLLLFKTCQTSRCGSKQIYNLR